MATKPTAPKAPSSTLESPAEAPAGTPLGAGTALAASGSGALALPADLAAEFDAAAKEAAAKERPSVAKISLKGGQMSYMGNQLPGAKIDAVLIGVGYWQKYYEGAFNPNVTVNPTCFAVKAGDKTDMVPHANVEEPVNSDCTSCKLNQWQSDPRGGKGKACKESRRLALIPVSALESVESMKKAEIAVLDLPPTSIKNYANFVNGLAASVKRPMWAVITTVQVVPNPKTQFEVKLTPISTIDDPEILMAIKGRLEEAERACTIPYDEAYLQGETRDQDHKSPTSGRTAKFKA